MSQAKGKYAGLTDEQAAQSRAENGMNVLTPPAREPLWKQYLESFEDPLIRILLVAGAFSLMISGYEHWSLGKPLSAFFEPVGIFVAIFLATGLAFLFEQKANKAFNLLNQVNDDEPVEAIRNGNAVKIPKKDVVVGDILIISTGEEIPADAELLEAVSLSVDESSLTGEPSCRKSTDPALFDKEATFPTNHVMRGTKAMEGHGICRVFAVGDKTENGKVFSAAQIDDSVKTPLNEQLDRLGDWITKASYGFAAAIVFGRVLMYFACGSGAFSWIDFIAYLLQTVMIAVTLIVVAVPEGLPMAVTLSLAYSMRSMLQTNNLVRKMHACETMGATTVICTDKTGTLTQNKMQVAGVHFYGLDGRDPDGTGDAYTVFCESLAANSTAQLDLSDESNPAVVGNPTEGALLLWLRQNGISYQDVRNSSERIAELPFSTARKYMATTVRSGTGMRILYVKGAPEIVRVLCSGAAGNVSAEETSQQLQEFQAQAMRTLGFAYQVLDGDDTGITENGLSATNLTFLGIVGISDPVRAEVPHAVKECFDAGIQVKIVTGDTAGTAKEIGRQIGLWTRADSDANIITGPEFAALSDEEARKRVPDLKIIARARPMDKERLVRTLQALGEVVAVTGDGTNDAPALHAAHVGLSMGDGTAVAKEASDITIIDNSFGSIGRAVMWGRSLFRNIQRFILFQMTVNVAACFVVLFGAFMGTESPLTVTQMLWVNLIMDTFAAMALASLPPSEDVMNSRPRDRNAFIVDKAMGVRILGIGGGFFLLLIWLVFVFEHANVTSILDIFCPSFQIGKADGLSPYELSMFFTVFVMLQFWNLFNARAFKTGRSALHLGGCTGFITIAAIIFVGQLLIVSVGGEFFNVVPLHCKDWIAIITGTSLVLWLGELARFANKRCACAKE